MALHHLSGADMTNRGTFIPTNNYSQLVAEIADLLLRPCPLGEKHRQEWLENEIKILLGVVGDIWPREIYGAVIFAALEGVANRVAVQ